MTTKVFSSYHIRSTFPSLQSSLNKSQRYRSEMINYVLQCDIFILQHVSMKLYPQANNTE